MESKFKNVFKFISLTALLTTGSVNTYTGVIDTTKVSFILDGNRIPAYVIIKGLQKGDIKGINTSTSTLDALRRFGEKYRYGISVYITKKQGE